MNDCEHFELFLKGNRKYKKELGEKFRFKSKIISFEAPKLTKREEIQEAWIRLIIQASYHESTEDGQKEMDTRLEDGIDRIYLVTNWRMEKE